MVAKKKTGKPAIRKKKSAITAGKKPSKRAAPAGKKAAARKTSAVRKEEASALAARDRERLKDALLDLRERINGRVVALRDDSLRRNDRVNTEEDGTDAFERQFWLTIASSEQDSLYAIDEALRRLAEGSYGVCCECSGPIEKPRLHALPFVTTCVSCQSRLEKTGLAKRRAM
ncbi:MAG: hypothetical protein FJ225_01415 [Lentisphaerae bacterium]|nr:hypothetical protein [Lentisphaerota bacterium]